MEIIIGRLFCHFIGLQAFGAQAVVILAAQLFQCFCIQRISFTPAASFICLAAKRFAAFRTILCAHTLL